MDKKQECGNGELQGGKQDKKKIDIAGQRLN